MSTELIHLSDFKCFGILVALKREQSLTKQNQIKVLYFYCRQFRWGVTEKGKKKIGTIFFIDR